MELYKIDLDTPIGKIQAVATPDGVVLMQTHHRKDFARRLEKVIRRFADQKQEPVIVVDRPNSHLERLKEELAEYFEGKRKEFSVPIVVEETPFRQKVWDILQKIPCGEVISYKEEAEKIKAPKAVRAVANANAANLIEILIPCHRVNGSDGRLKGFGSGLKTKAWLQQHERTIKI